MKPAAAAAYLGIALETLSDVMRRAYIARQFHEEVLMFDFLDLALQSYKEICAESERDGRPQHIHRLIDWLCGDAVDAIDNLVSRPDFRAEARWSVERLQPGATGPERGLVDTVDDALVQHAAALLQFAQNRGIRERLAQHIDAAPHSPGLGEIESIASRPWRDLVSTFDFLQPTAGLNLKVRAAAQPAAFVPMFHDPLRQPGDHVAGMLLRRVKYWLQDLERFRCRCLTVLNTSPAITADFTAVSETGGRLSHCVSALRALFAPSPEQRLRNACVVLVQAYAEFSPKPHLHWLQVAHEIPAQGNLRFWLEHNEIMVASRIAAALTEASYMFRCKVPPEDVLKEAARSHALVAAQGLGTRILFWHGKSVEIPWKGQSSWEVLWALCLRTKQGQGLDHLHFGSGGRMKALVSRHALAVRVDRLKNRLPHDLSSLIDGKTAPGTYLFRLDSKEIFLAEVFEDSIAETTGSMDPREMRTIASLT